MDAYLTTPIKVFFVFLNIILKGEIKMKVKSHVIAILLVMALFAMSGCSNTASVKEEASVKPIEIKLAHFFPSSHPIEVDLVEPWAKAIEEATEGRVVITSYPGQTLLQADAIYQGVVDGISEMGLSCFSYTRGTFPVLEAFELPGITYANSKVATKVAWEGIKELNPKEVQDTKLMMVIATGPGDLYTKVPVKELSDLQGLELRATGLSAKTLEALGATPVAMAQSEAYEALSKGVVQGNLGPIEVLKGWNQAEVTKNLTLTPFLYNTLFFITINNDIWDSINEKDQKAILAINEEFMEKVAAGLWDKQNAEALKWAQKEEGVEVFTLSEEETNKWKSMVKPIQEDFVNKMNEKGFKGQEILDKVITLSEKYNSEN